MTVAVSGDSITFPDNSVQATAPKVGMVNRIINGAMVIDQRNAGASVTTPAGYTLDRWQVLQSTTGKISTQQNQGSVTPASGFNTYLGITSSSAYSVGAGDYYLLLQNIEGFNVADLGYGTANAKTVTISFQVYSSLTGTFGGALTNGAGTRSYPFTYAVSAANTWTTASVTIVGDTTGTWPKNNTTGMQVIFGLGVGSTSSGTAGSWSGSTYYSATGSVSVVGTSGATFYITGVQLEKGSTATSFDYRPYGTELGLCQRYAYQMNANDSNGANRFAFGLAQVSTKGFAQTSHPVPMRIKPSLTTTVANLALSDTMAGTSLTSISIQGVTSDVNKTCFDCTTASGLTAFRLYFLEAASSAAYILLSAEL